MSSSRTFLPKPLDGTVVKTVRRVLSLTSKGRSVSAIVGLTFSNFIEIVGLTLLIPIFSLALFGEKEHVSRKAEILLQAEQWLGVGLPNSLGYLVGFFIAILLLKSLIVIAITRANSRIVSQVTQSVRIRLIRALLAARWSYFVDQKVGHLSHLVTTEANMVGETFDTAIAYCTALLQIIMYLILACIISWQLAAYFMVLGPAIFFVFSRLLKWSKKAAHEHAQATHAMSSAFVDVLVNMKTIKVMNLEHSFTRSFLRDTRDSEKSQRLKVFSADFARELQEPIVACAMVAFLLLAVREISSTASGILVLGVIFVRTADTFYSIQRMHQRLTLRSIYLDWILDIVANVESQSERTGGGLAPTLQKALAFENVSFSYSGGHRALVDCKIIIPAKSVTVIIGPSGAGKTTLLDLILGLQQPTLGRILADDTPLTDVDLKAWRRLIGYVPQEINLFNANIRANVALGDIAVPDERIWHALRLAGAIDFVERFPEKLDHVVGERGMALSGGQRQRITLARALLYEPKLLVFDEATSALDPTTEEEIGNHLASLARELGLTVIAVTHRPYWVGIADQILTVENGVVNSGGREASSSLHG